MIFNSEGKLIGRDRDLPERCAQRTVLRQVRHRNRLFMASSTSVYSLFVNTQARPSAEIFAPRSRRRKEAGSAHSLLMSSATPEEYSCNTPAAEQKSRRKGRPGAIILGMPLRKSPACAALFLVIASLLHAESEVEVDVVVDMTAEGRKIAHPDSAHPAYSSSRVVGGFQEMGATVRGEKMPSPHDVVHLVAVALARQGYRVAKPAPWRERAQGEITYADGTVVTVPPFINPGHRIGLNEPGNVPLGPWRCWKTRKGLTLCARPA